MNRNILILLGPPGSGKGSLSRLAIKKMGWQQLSTGNLCRQHIEAQSEIGKKIDFTIKSGKLISDSLIINMVNEWLQLQAIDFNTVIFDGFPRTVAQAVALDNLLNTSFNSIKQSVVKLDITDDVVLERLCARTICGNTDCQAVYSLQKDSELKPLYETMCDECGFSLKKRSDDEERAIKERLKIYYQHENELLKYYLSIGHEVKRLNVEQSLDRVYNNLLKVLDVKIL